MNRQNQAEVESACPRWPAARTLIPTIISAVTLALSQLAQAQSPADPAAAARTSAMLPMLEKIVAKDPARAGAWRMIGRIAREQGDTRRARECFLQAVNLQPQNAAAHFDLARILEQQGEAAAARWHDDKVLSLAPGSSYAGQVRQRRGQPEVQQDNFHATHDDSFPAGQNTWADQSAFFEEANGSQDVALAGFEIQTFDGADEFETQIDRTIADATPAPLRLFFETGVVYNSNVQLTPVSRELTADAPESFQAIFNPSVEWIAWRTDQLRAGPLFRGLFAVNEGHQQDFDLASFQPGVFLERDLGWPGQSLSGRIDYVYSLDLLGGARTGDRHAVTGSLTAISPQQTIIYAFVSASTTQFDDDGANPSVDSLDGPAVFAGINRAAPLDGGWLTWWSIGAGVESARTRGADFRYRAVTINGDLTFQLTPWLKFVPETGFGYRVYPDFTRAINRDTFTWRAGGELIWQCTSELSAALTFSHERFDSDNPQFTAERTEAGIVLTYIR